MLDLESAIKHAEGVAEKEERRAKLHQRPDKDVKGSGKRYLSCIECAKEHRQLAEWLRELKKLREQTRWIPVSERLPEEATNGDMIQAMFPYGEYGANGNEVHVFGVGGNGCLVFTLDWWNAPYKVESEDKK